MQLAVQGAPELVGMRPIEWRNHKLCSLHTEPNDQSYDFLVHVDAKCSLRKLQLANAQKIIALPGRRNQNPSDRSHHQNSPHKVSYMPANIDGVRPQDLVVWATSTLRR